eukprot:scaffold4518_cov410-Prasinococcus_capsulatus_cf.AAC.10
MHPKPIEGDRLCVLLGRRHLCCNDLIALVHPSIPIAACCLYFILILHPIARLPHCRLGLLPVHLQHYAVNSCNRNVVHIWNLAGHRRLCTPNAQAATCPEADTSVQSEEQPWISATYLDFESVKLLFDVKGGMDIRLKPGYTAPASTATNTQNRQGRAIAQSLSGEYVIPACRSHASGRYAHSRYAAVDIASQAVAVSYCQDHPGGILATLSTPPCRHALSTYWAIRSTGKHAWVWPSQETTRTCRSLRDMRYRIAQGTAATFMCSGASPGCSLGPASRPLLAPTLGAALSLPVRAHHPA